MLKGEWIKIPQVGSVRIGNRVEIGACTTIDRGADRFVTPEEFAGYEKAAFGKGFLMVSATPLTRSSYHAGDDFARLRAARLKKLGR